MYVYVYVYVYVHVHVYVHVYVYVYVHVYVHAYVHAYVYVCRSLPLPPLIPEDLSINNQCSALTLASLAPESAVSHCVERCPL